MRHFFRFGFVSAAVLAATGFAGVRPSRAVPPQKVIYDGQSPTSAGMQLFGWGSGQAAPAKQAGYAGAPDAIKISTHGFYAGGRIAFSKPVDLTEQFTDPDSRYGFLEFICQFPTAQPPMARAGGLGAPPEGPPVPDTQFVRVQLIFEDGTAEVANQPVVLRPANEPNWFTLDIPFVSLKGLDKIKKFQLKEIRLFGDAEDNIIIGAIRTTSDDEPISIEPLEEGLVVAVNDPVEFSAIASAGISTLKYSWDFDDADGIQEDAVGPVVVHAYKKPSPMSPTNPDELKPYTVTLTVTDVSGAKKPEVRKTTVTVNP